MWRQNLILDHFGKKRERNWSFVSTDMWKILLTLFHMGGGHFSPLVTESAVACWRLLQICCHFMTLFPSTLARTWLSHLLNLCFKRGNNINTQMVTESARFDIYGWNNDFNSSINVEFHDKQLCKNQLLSQRPLSTLKPSIYTFKIDFKIDPFYLQWFPVKMTY